MTSRDEKVEKTIFHQRTSAGNNQISAGKKSPTSPKKLGERSSAGNIWEKKSIKITCLVVLDEPSPFFHSAWFSFLSNKYLQNVKKHLYWKIPTISIAVAGKWLCLIFKKFDFDFVNSPKKQFGVENSENPMPPPVNKFFWVGGVGWAGGNFQSHLFNGPFG